MDSTKKNQIIQSRDEQNAEFDDDDNLAVERVIDLTTWRDRPIQKDDENIVYI